MENENGVVAEVVAESMGVETPKAGRQAKPKSLIATLGSVSFIAGDGRKYPRQTGFGANKKEHPDGGTNETAAHIVFRPFGYDGLTLEGRVYCERWIAASKRHTKYSIALSFLKIERRDSVARDAVESLKIQLRTQFEKWMQETAKTTGGIKKAVSSADAWEMVEDVEPTPAKS